MSELVIGHGRFDAYPEAEIVKQSLTNIERRFGLLLEENMKLRDRVDELLRMLKAATAKTAVVSKEERS